MTMLVRVVRGTLAAPAFASLLESGRVRAATQGCVTALHLAQEIAARRAARSLVCPSADGTHCIDDGHREADWIVAINPDRNGQPDTAPLLGSDRDVAHSSARRAQRLRMQSTAGSSMMVLSAAGRVSTSR